MCSSYSVEKTTTHWDLSRSVDWRPASAESTRGQRRRRQRSREQREEIFKLFFLRLPSDPPTGIETWFPFVVDKNILLHSLCPQDAWWMFMCFFVCRLCVSLHRHMRLAHSWVPSFTLVQKNERRRRRTDFFYEWERDVDAAMMLSESIQHTFPFLLIVSLR